MTRPSCTHESHAAAKANFAGSPELRFRGLQFDERDLVLVYVDCTLCWSTLAIEPDVYAAAMLPAVVPELVLEAA